MEQQQFPNSVPTANVSEPVPYEGFNSGFGLNAQSLVIFVMGTLLLLSFLGINIFTVFADGLNWLNKNVLPSIYSFFGMVSYSTGDLIDRSSDVAADAAKVGVDLAEGAAHSVGGIAKGLGEIGMQHSPELKSRYKPPSEPKPDTTVSEIQSGYGKGAWCLVGDVKGVRNCLEVDKDTKCASGQLFPDSASCLKPPPAAPTTQQTPSVVPTPSPDAPSSNVPLPIPMMDRPVSSTVPPVTQSPRMFEDAMNWEQNNQTRWNAPINQQVFRGETSEAERQAQELLRSYA